MEENKTYVCETCSGGRMCCSPRHRPYSILRWVLGAVIIFMAFGLGMKIGRLEGELGSSYTRHMPYFRIMTPSNGEGQNVFYAPAGGKVMMQGVQTQQ